LAWETGELRSLQRFLEAIRAADLRPLEILEQPVADLYGRHWSLTGEGVPEAGTPDDAVYLPARNLLLLGKAAVWCHLRGVPELALATLGTNPFPDASPTFFEAYQAAVNEALQSAVRIRRPFEGLDKTAVMRLGRALPLWLTFSCIRPIAGLHCGVCNKCEERKHSFEDAAIDDQTAYHDAIKMPR
jgi:7-cyano-7-deazaguanine synthase